MIRRTYLKMTGPQILASVSSMLCLLIDSVVISRFLGVDAMSAYGLVSPMIIVVNAGILMISCGAQVFAAAALGRGDMEDLGAGYSTAMAGAAGISLIIMLAVFTAAGPVCGLLGANRSNVPPNVSEMTEQYLKGYFIGTPFFFLVQLATPYLQTMGKRKELMWSVICMTVSDIVLDILSVTVFHAGIAGIGIASGLSYLAAFLPVSGFFLKKDRIFRFDMRKIRWKTLIRIAVQGGPVFMSFACYFLRVYCFNQMFLSIGGTDAVAVYSIVSVPGDILYRIGQGSGDVTLTIASLLFEEEDRRSLTELVRVMVRYSLLMICGAVLLTCAVAPWIISLYLGRASHVFDSAVTALRLFAVSFIPSCLVCVFEHYFQGIRRLKMTHLLVVCDGFALTASMAWIFGKLLGLNGIWYGVILGQAATVLVLSLYVWKKARKVTLSAEAYSCLDNGFGADPGDILDFTVTDRSGAAAASETMRVFYLEKGVRSREAMLVSLCTEEIAMNILTHGFTADRRKHTLEIRTVHKGDRLTLHFRDNCVLFDPTEYAALHQAGGPDHIGLRMVMDLVDEAVYVNSLGLNNLFFTVHTG